MIRKSMKHKRCINLPGKALLKFVEYGIPKYNGVYFVYYKPQSTRAMNNTFPVANWTIVSVDEGMLHTKEHVLAFIGPLPVLTLDEVEKGFEKEKLSLHTYFTGTLKDAVKGIFKHGPFVESISIHFQKAEVGDYGFEVNQRTTLPVPIRFFSKKHNKWRFLKNSTKALKKMKKHEKQQKERLETIYKTKNTTPGHYVIATIWQILKNKKLKKYKTIIDAYGVIPKENALYKSYIFEITKKGKAPTDIWNNGWGTLSNKKIRAIRKRIGDL